MTSQESIEVTQHLAELRSGDSSAADRMMPLVYAELRRMAGHLFRDQRANHTLQPTGLVHVRGDEAYENRTHFYSVAAMAMRQLLVDYARQHKAQKRGGDRERVVLEEAEAEGKQGLEIDLILLDEALDDLARLDPRQAKVVELRFLAGLSVPAPAEALGVSARTVTYDWRMARFWLENRLTG